MTRALNSSGVTTPGILRITDPGRTTKKKNPRDFPVTGVFLYLGHVVRLALTIVISRVFQPEETRINRDICLDVLQRHTGDLTVRIHGAPA